MIDVEIQRLQTEVKELREGLGQLSALFIAFAYMPFLERLLWAVGGMPLYDRIARWRGVR